MKKLFLPLFLILGISLFGETYPQSLWYLLSSYSEKKYEVSIVAADSIKYKGKIILVQDDYIVMKLDNEDVVVLTINSLSEISHE